MKMHRHRVRAAGALLLLCAVAAGCGTGGDARQATTNTDSKPAATTGERPAARPSSRELLEQVVDRMSRDEQAGQLVMTRLEGQSLAASDARVIRGQHLGGVILFAYNYASPSQLRAMVADVQAAGRDGNKTGVGMLVSVDQEGGPIRRFADQPPLNSQVQLGRLGDPAAVEKSARATGTALAALGVNMNLAPVADLALPPERVMAYRSFGSDPKLVGELVAASVRGMQAGGVSASVKHFPGFGAATANSDDALAAVSRTRDQLRDDLAPFGAAVDAETDSVMISHAIYSGYDAKLPASIAPQIIEPILRDQLDYDGVAITDSMNAKGLRGGWSGTVPTACAQAVKVGIDIVLVTGSMETARLCRQRIVDAVGAGNIPESRLREAVLRVLTLKHKHNLVRLPRDGGGMATSTPSVSVSDLKLFNGGNKEETACLKAYVEQHLPDDADLVSPEALAQLGEEAEQECASE